MQQERVMSSHAEDIPRGDSITQLQQYYGQLASSFATIIHKVNEGGVDLPSEVSSGSKAYKIGTALCSS